MARVDPLAISPRAILDLLRVKHSDDVCVDECHDGPRRGGSLSMDLWVMPRSWSKPWVSAYEIKVSRSDFMRDDKWPNYLPLCNQFAFVCPWNLISPEELPADVGLFWASKNLSKLYCKRKPALRKDVEIPETVFRYVLMSRCKVGPSNMSPRHFSGAPGRDEIADYLEGREESYRVDQLFKAAIKKQVEREVSEALEKNTELKKENARLQRQIEAADEVTKALKEVGADIHPNNYRSVADQLRSHFGVGEWDIGKLRSAHEQLGKILEHIPGEQS